MKGVGFPIRVTFYKRRIFIDTSAIVTSSGKHGNWRNLSIFLIFTIFFIFGSFLHNEFHVSKGDIQHHQDEEKIFQQGLDFLSQIKETARTKRNSPRVLQPVQQMSAHLLPHPSQRHRRGSILRWTGTPSSAREGYTYAHNSMFRVANNGKMSVLHDGFYHLYLQITVAHQRGRHCAFETWVEKVTSTSVNKLAVMTTIVRGHSAFQAGIFKLLKDEEIYIKQVATSHCPIVFRWDRTYFGGFLLKSI